MCCFFQQKSCQINTVRTFPKTLSVLSGCQKPVALEFCFADKLESDKKAKANFLKKIRFGFLETKQPPVYRSTPIHKNFPRPKPT